ncbi:MAG TPA: amidohydrolase family protein [Clostridia bacterium]|nr:amidohydrolase family protein [Clostridia bacterium]
MSSYNSIYDHICDMPIINTHCHHLKDQEFINYDLIKAISTSYVIWQYGQVKDTPEGRQDLFNKMGANTYFTWLSRALGELYGNSPLSFDNWGRIAAAIKERYAKNPDYHMDILKNVCKYETIVLDKYEKPGSNNGWGINRPTFRCDMFLFGFSPGRTDNNNNNPYDYFDATPESLDEYIAMMEKVIEKKKSDGCSALKLAIAYERGLDFSPGTREKAKKAFMSESANNEEIKAFGDHVVFELARIAAQLDMPIQIHTGLGGLYKTNAMQLFDLIKLNPHTRFVLFHCSYPWTDDVLGLAHVFSNVFPDTCWLPLISTAAAERFLDEAIDLMDSTRMAWGCDTWNSEDSYGALLAMRYVLARVLAKKVDKGLIPKDIALHIAQNILYNNAKRIYNL